MRCQVVLLLFVSIENAAERDDIHCRQPGVFPVSAAGRAALHHAPARHHRLRIWLQPAAVVQGSMCSVLVFNVNPFNASCSKFLLFKGFRVPY